MAPADEDGDSGSKRVARAETSDSRHSLLKRRCWAAATELRARSSVVVSVTLVAAVSNREDVVLVAVSPAPMVGAAAVVLLPVVVAAVALLVGAGVDAKARS